MVDYEKLEDEIVQKLNSDEEFPVISDAIPLPDDIDSYKTPTLKGLVTAVFVSDKFDANQSIGQISQHSTLVLNISIQSRKRRGDTGVYKITSLVMDLLTGFAPTDCGPLALGEYSFSDYQNDVWEYGITFSCRSFRNQITASENPLDIITDDEVLYSKNSIDENIHL